MEDSLKEWDKSLEKRQIMDRNRGLDEKNDLNNLRPKTKDKAHSADL